MDQDPELGEWIYRAMLEESGKPKIGSTATTLGIRAGQDIEVDSAGMVHRPLFLPGGKNGLSCAPSVDQLPPFALPVKWGGQHRRSEVWKIRVIDLPADLIAKADEGDHISVGPDGDMSFDDYDAAVKATVEQWVKVV